MNPFRHRQKNVWPRPCDAPSAGSYSNGAGLRGGELAEVLPDVIFYTDAPAVSAANLPNGETLKFELLESTSSPAGGETGTVMGIQTGAGGVGAPAAFFAVRPKLQGGQWFVMRITASAGANISGSKYAYMNVGIAGPTTAS